MSDEKVNTAPYPGYPNGVTSPATLLDGPKPIVIGAEQNSKIQDSPGAFDSDDKGPSSYSGPQTGDTRT